MISRLLAHNLLIRETSGIRIKNSNSNEHVTRRRPAHVETECYMLEEDSLLCLHSGIYTLLDRHTSERAKGPKGQNGQFAELVLWTVEMVPSM